MINRKKQIATKDRNEKVENLLIIGIIAAIILVLVYFAIDSLFPFSLSVIIIELMLIITVVGIPISFLYFYFKDE
jgi:membrane protein YdbS with pleckstrin-like domain